MEFERIVQDFARSERVPVDAIRAATAEPDAFVPHAVLLLERVMARQATPLEQDAVCVLVHVLGEISDRRALRPLIDMMALPRDDLERVLGDAITESLSRILMRLVAAGDEQVMQAAMDEPTMDDFARAAVFDAWVYLTLTSQIARDDARAYLADFPARVRPEVDSYTWVSWVDAVSNLGFEDLSGLVERVFAEGNIPVQAIGGPAIELSDFRQQLNRALENPEALLKDRNYQPFQDTVAELSGWYGYSEDFIRQKKISQNRVPDFLSAPAVNSYRDVGRNDPCPCGSGNKFKKCCLVLAAE